MQNVPCDERGVSHAAHILREDLDVLGIESVMRREPLGQGIGDNLQVARRPGEEVVEREHNDEIGLLEIGESCACAMSASMLGSTPTKSAPP